MRFYRRWPFPKLFSRFLQRAIDGPIRTGQLERLGIFITLLLMVGLIRFGFQALEGFTSQKFGQQLTSDVRNDLLFQHVTSLASSFFDRTTGA